MPSLAAFPVKEIVNVASSSAPRPPPSGRSKHGTKKLALSRRFEQHFGVENANFAVERNFRSRPIRTGHE
jgi:hypothetical protein